MKRCWSLVLIITVHSTSFIVGGNNKTFPDDFMFGVSTSAYQVEGGWSAGGKSETIWDRLLHQNPSYAKDNATGDVATDFYHKYRSDIDLLLKLGIKHYKFSISWSRIFPTGIPRQFNLDAISYYEEIITRLQSSGVKTVVSLYHWDLPQSLQDIGGWTNPDIVKYFVEYARIAFTYLRTARYWITFDEPKQICRSGYGTGALAPGISVDGVAEYLCAYVVLKAHAAVYDLYKREFLIMNAKVGMVIDVPWSEPYTEKTEDVTAAERRNQFMIGLYANPIVHGNWPEVVRNRVQERSFKENFTRSRLPQFTKEEMDYIKGSYDFLGVNFYDTRYVSDDQEADYGSFSFDNDMRVQLHVNKSWLVGTDGNPIVPWGLRKALSWVKTTYNNPTIFITDNSIADNGTFEDGDRIQYLTDYLDNLLDAMYEDDVTVTGYTVKFMDQFEWYLGYSAHGGLYFVDFLHPDLLRTPKQSVEYYQQIATSLSIPSNITTTVPPTTTTEGATTEESTTTGESTSTSTSTPAVTTEPSTGTTEASSYKLQPFPLIVILITVMSLGAIRIY